MHHLVKLRKMALSEQTRIVVEQHDSQMGSKPSIAGFKDAAVVIWLPMREKRLMLERLEAGTNHGEVDCPDGEEILILSATPG